MVEAIGSDCLWLVAAYCPSAVLSSSQGQRFDSADHELDLSHLWRVDVLGNVMVRY